MKTTNALYVVPTLLWMMQVATSSNLKGKTRGLTTVFSIVFDLGLSDGQGKFSLTRKHYNSPTPNEPLLKQIFTPKIRIGNQYVPINSKAVIVLLILSVIVGIIFLMIMPLH